MSMALRTPPVSPHSTPCSLVKAYQPSDTSQVNFPTSPPQSECESVTPRSQPYLNTPPILDADIFDTIPFSVSTNLGAYQRDPEQLCCCRRRSRRSLTYRLKMIPFKAPPSRQTWPWFPFKMLSAFRARLRPAITSRCAMSVVDVHRTLTTAEATYEYPRR